METIQIKSKLDLKSYFKIALKTYINIRTLIMVSIMLVALQVFVFDPAFTWLAEGAVVGGAYMVFSHQAYYT